MLVLSRKVGGRVLIGGSVIVTVIATQGRSVKIGVEGAALRWWCSAGSWPRRVTPQ